MPLRLGKIKDFQAKSKFYPIAHQGSFIETFLDLVLNDVENLADNKYNNNNNTTAGHLTQKEQEALRSLENNHSLVIRNADKGGGTVLQNYADYQSEALRILSDNEYY